MPNSQKSHDTLTGLFREIVLVLGGVFALRGTDDETVRQVATGLAAAWNRARARANYTPEENPHIPHPAIAALLRLTEDEQPGGKISSDGLNPRPSHPSRRRRMRHRGF